MQKKKTFILDREILIFDEIYVINMGWKWKVSAESQKWDANISKKILTFSNEHTQVSRFNM